MKSYPLQKSAYYMNILNPWPCFVSDLLIIQTAELFNLSLGEFNQNIILGIRQYFQKQKEDYDVCFSTKSLALIHSDTWENPKSKQKDVQVKFVFKQNWFRKLQIS